MSSAALTEISNLFDTLDTFFKEGAEYVEGTASVPPELDDILGLTLDEMTSFVMAENMRAASFQTGSVQESASTLAAIQREIDMATQNKSAVYQSHSSELDSEGQFYYNQGTYFFGVSSGAQSNGSQS